jgi:crotonobetainyl-CoA:carnitine CoA-transferase CaiB-like acyl-CoA transferase
MRRLLTTADVVVENFAVRVLEQLGLTWELIHEVAPRTILVRVPGYGIEGPWRDHVGWGSSFEQLCGHAWVTGYPDGPPVPPGGYLDPTVGAHAAVALCAALDHRDRTGEAQLVEVAQIEVGAYTSVDQVLTTQLTGTPPLRAGNRSPDAEPQGVFLAADERWVAASIRPTDRAACLDLLGLPAETSRRTGDGVVERALSSWIGEHPAAVAVTRLRDRGIPATEVMFGDGMYAAAQLAARDFYQTIEHPVSGTRRYPGLPMHFWFADPVRFARPAPTIGQHNTEILGGELGLDPAELERLERAGVIGTGMRT